MNDFKKFQISIFLPGCQLQRRSFDRIPRGRIRSSRISPLDDDVITTLDDDVIATLDDDVITTLDDDVITTLDDDVTITFDYDTMATLGSIIFQSLELIRI